MLRHRSPLALGFLRTPARARMLPPAGRKHNRHRPAIGLGCRLQHRQSLASTGLAAIQSWSTSLQQRLFKTGGRLIRHARYFVLQLAESYLTLTLFRQILARIERLGWHPT